MNKNQNIRYVVSVDCQCCHGGDSYYYSTKKEALKEAKELQSEMGEDANISITKETTTREQQWL